MRLASGLLSEPGGTAPLSFDVRRRTAVAYMKTDRKTDKTLVEVLKKVHHTGLEPVTFGSVDRCSIQLS